MEWIKVEDRLPDVHPADGFGEYYESELMVVAFEWNNKIRYEIAKYTKGRDSSDDEFWESWWCPEAGDIVINVVAWAEFDKYNK